MEKLILSIPFYAETFNKDDFIARSISTNSFDIGPYPEGYNLNNNLDCLIGFREFEKIQKISKDNSSPVTILFRAIVHNSQTKHLIIGLYNASEMDIREIAPGIYNLVGENAHFVSANDSVDVSEKIIAYNLQNKVLRNNSTNHPEYKLWLENWEAELLSRENKFEQYKNYCIQLRQKLLA